jgi:hypothetical protein
VADVGLENVTKVFPGGTVAVEDFSLDMGRVHLFDDQTGCNIGLEPEHVAHAS